jgi:hypothetical protein
MPALAVRDDPEPEIMIARFQKKWGKRRSRCLTNSLKETIMMVRRRYRLIRKTVPYGARSAPDVRKAEGKVTMT